MPESAHISGPYESGPMLDSLGRAVAGALSGKDICRALADAVMAHIPSDGAWVSAVQADSGQVSRIYATGKGEKSARGPARQFSGSIEEAIAESGATMVMGLDGISGFSFADRHAAALKRSGIRSLLIAPLHASDELFGVIGVNAIGKDAFDESHVGLFEAAIEAIRAPLGVAESYGKLARQVHVSQIISTVIRAANSADSIDGLAQAIAVELRAAMPMDRLDLALTGEGEMSDISLYEWGIPASEWQSRLRSTGGDGLLAHVASSRKPWMSNDVRALDVINKFPALEAAARDGIRSMIAAPMALHGRMAGALICSSSQTDAYFGENASTLVNVADHISGAALIHMMRERTAREAEELAVIAEIGRTLSSSLDANQAFLAFVGLVRSLIPFDRVVVSSYAAEQGLLTDLYVAGIPLPSFEPGTTVRSSEAMGASMLEDRKTIRYDEAMLKELSAEFTSPREGLEAGLRSMMSVPLTWQNEVIGTLNFRSRLPSAYGEREQATAERVAAQIAGAIATSRLYTQLAHEAEVRKSLAAISLAASKDLDLSNVFERAADGIARIMDYDRISIALIDQRTSELRLRYFRGMELPERPLDSAIHMDPRINRWRLTFQRSKEEGSFYGTEAQLRSHDKSAVTWRPALGGVIESRIEVPLGTETAGVVGYFGVSSLTPGKYTLDDLITIERIAIHITPAIQKAVTYQQAVDLGEERSRSAELQAQAEELERLNNVKGQFLSTVTHELKTPLTSIMAFTDILSRNKTGNLNERQVSQVEAVRRNAAQLQSLINDLVDVSRIESGQLSLIEREFDLGELLQEIGSNMQPQFNARKQKLKYELPGDPIIMIADRDRIAQVIMNLLSNASKFSSEGSKVVVTASSEPVWCTFSVRDEGVGIGPHDQTHLFAAFYRADNSITREHGGTGLGLSIVKSIVDLHGGRITVDSAPGKGSTFTVGLPRRLELKEAS